MDKFRVKLTSDPNVIGDLAIWSDANAEVVIDQPVEEHPGPAMGWELDTVANIVTIDNAAVFLGQMAAAIYGSIKKNKSTISIQTAKGEVTISWSDDLSIDDMRAILEHTLDDD